MVAGDVWDTVRSEWEEADIVSDNVSGLTRVCKKVREAVLKELAAFACCF